MVHSAHKRYQAEGRVLYHGHHSMSCARRRRARFDSTRMSRWRYSSSRRSHSGRRPARPYWPITRAILAESRSIMLNYNCLGGCSWHSHSLGDCSLILACLRTPPTMAPYPCHKARVCVYPICKLFYLRYHCLSSARQSLTRLPRPSGQFQSHVRKARVCGYPPRALS